MRNFLLGKRIVLKDTSQLYHRRSYTQQKFLLWIPNILISVICTSENSEFSLRKNIKAIHRVKYSKIKPFFSHDKYSGH